MRVCVSQDTMLTGWPLVRAVEAWQRSAEAYRLLAVRVRTDEGVRSPAEDAAVRKRLALLKGRMIQGAAALESAASPDGSDLATSLERVRAEVQGTGDGALEVRLDILERELVSTLQGLRGAHEACRRVHPRP